MRARLLAIKVEVRRTMHDPTAKTGAWIKRMLQGHLNDFAVSGNHPGLWGFFNGLKRLWLMSLRGAAKRHASADKMTVDNRRQFG
jgi:RNA-directed DNA polymerase